MWQISDYGPELFFSDKLFLVIYWNAILDRFKFSAQTNRKVLFKSYSIVSKAELLRNKKGELVKIKHDLATNSVVFYLFQRWEPSDLLVTHSLFLVFCVSVFLYYGIFIFVPMMEAIRLVVIPLSSHCYPSLAPSPSPNGS